MRRPRSPRPTPSARWPGPPRRSWPATPGSSPRPASSRPPTDTEEDEEHDAPALIAGTRNMESILDVMSFQLPPPNGTRTLAWHYRSRDERLIAFSNAQPNLYNWALTTFPGVAGPDCLSPRRDPVPARPPRPGGLGHRRGRPRRRAGRRPRPPPPGHVPRRDRHGHQARQPHPGGPAPRARHRRRPRLLHVRRRVSPGGQGAVLRQEPGTGPRRRTRRDHPDHRLRQERRRANAATASARSTTKAANAASTSPSPAPASP